MTTRYVRPDAGGPYGAHDGSTYADAWAGFANIIWANIGAGGTLYVCGNTYSYSTGIATGTTGAYSGNEATIRGDYPGDPALITFTSGGSWTVGASNIKYLNLSVVGYNNPAMYIYAPLANYLSGANGTNITFTNVTLNNCYFDIEGGSTTGNGYKGLSFINCTVYNGRAGILFFGGSSGKSTTAFINGITIYGCNIHDITDVSGGYGTALDIRLQSGNFCDPGTCYISNMVITNNTITNVGLGVNGGCFIRVVAYTGTLGNGQSISSGCVITNNTMNGSGSLTSSTNLGGVFVEGFNSLTKSFTSGENVFANNNIQNMYNAPAGGCDIVSCSYLNINNNVINNAQTVTIDGNGIIIDLTCDHILIYNNTISNCLGATAFNSGGGLVVLNSSYIYAYNNTFTNCKYGLFLYTYPVVAPSWIVGNTFAGITLNGIYMANQSNDKSQFHIHSNIFLGNNSNDYFYYNANISGTISPLAYDNISDKKTVDIQGNTVSGFARFANLPLAAQVPGSIVVSGYQYVGSRAIRSM